MPLSPQGWMTDEAATRIFAAIAEAGGEARFVGGCVRDGLLGRRIFDIDIASTLPPEAGMTALRQAGIKTVPTGLAHGTVTAVIGQRHYEITTLRRDEQCDGRHAQVEFTDDWREDAARRDFTMNALYATQDGKITDYFGGEADALAGRVRFIGEADARIHEDALRILRFFRFYAHYGIGAIDAAGLAACARYGALLERLSGERIQTEMLKLLNALSPQRALHLMAEARLLRHIALPEKPDVDALERLCALEPAPDALRRLALLLRGAPEQTGQLIHRWRLSNAAAARLRAIVPPVEGMEAWDDAAQKRALRRMGAERFADHLLLAEATQPDKAGLFAPMHRLLAEWPVPEFPLTGHDLLALGMPKGAGFGTMLKALEEWWEAHGYRHDAEALREEARRRLAP